MFSIAFPRIPGREWTFLTPDLEDCFSEEKMLIDAQYFSLKKNFRVQTYQNI